MKIKLLSTFLFAGLALFAQQNETKKIVKIQGNDTTIIDVQVNEVDAVIEKQMKISYGNDENIKGKIWRSIRGH